MTRQVERTRIDQGLVDAGVPAPVAGCLARRLVDRLTTAQLRRLRALQVPARSVGDVLAAVARVDDPAALRGAIDAAAACVAPHPL